MQELDHSTRANSANSILFQDIKKMNDINPKDDSGKSRCNPDNDSVDFKLLLIKKEQMRSNYSNSNEINKTLIHSSQKVEYSEFNVRDLLLRCIHENFQCCS